MFFGTNSSQTVSLYVYFDAPTGRSYSFAFVFLLRARGHFSIVILVSKYAYTCHYSSPTEVQRGNPSPLYLHRIENARFFNLCIRQENDRWNAREDSSKRWRFNQTVLRWVLYALHRVGSSGFEILREDLHLPTASHVRKVRDAASPVRPGIQQQNIQV